MDGPTHGVLQSNGLPVPQLRSWLKDPTVIEVSFVKKITAKTATKRFERLLSHGYFAPELPPCFVSERLAEKRSLIWKHIEAAKQPSSGGGVSKAKLAYKSYISQTSWFNFPRFGRSDRRHGLLNPIAYMAIANVLAVNFVQLRSRTRKLSRISVSPIVFDWTGTRAVLRPTVDLLDDFRLDLSSRREEYVSADLRAFYHSVYTHSIPWAIRGKAEAKDKAKRRDDHYCNLLDLLCRNAQDGQTIGLPVGPDTSRILGEVIASAVDAELVKNAKLSNLDASRYIDDYTISSADGRSALALTAALRRAAALYELELNQDKTSVVSTASAPISGWKQVALAHRPKRHGADLESFKRFFYEVGRVRGERPGINVERWALMNARSAILGCSVNTWKNLVRHLINAYRRNSTIVSLFVELIVARHQAAPGDVDREVLRDFLAHRIPVLALEDRTGELIWLLFLMIALRVTLSAKTFERLAKLEEPMCALLVRKAHHEGLVTGKLDTKTWDAHLTTEGLNGPMWLYAYEAPRQGLVSSGTAHIAAHQFFSVLLQQDVDFLSIERGASKIADADSGRRIDNSHQEKLRKAFQDFELDDEDLYGDLDEEDDLDWSEDY